MVSWIVRLVLAAAGAVAGWFVAIDSPTFELVRLSVGLLLLAFVVFVLAFWPRHWSQRLDRTRD